MGRVVVVSSSRKEAVHRRYSRVRRSSEQCARQMKRTRYGRRSGQIIAAHHNCIVRLDAEEMRARIRRPKIKQVRAGVNRAK